MHNIRDEEKTLIQLLEGNDPCARKALDYLCARFEWDEKMRPTIHPHFIRTIYVDQYESYLWKLALDNGVCETTLYRYRKMYINFFRKYYERERARAEAAATAGD